MLLLKDFEMSILRKVFKIQWLKDLKTSYDQKKQRKQIEYSEKRWERKLRGIKR